MIQHLTWDSAFFGFKTGMATDADVKGMPFGQLEAMIRHGQYRLVYFMAGETQKAGNAAEASAFEQLMQKGGAALMDRKVIYAREANACLKNFHNTQIVAENRIPVSEKLQSLALQAGAFSRFRKDPRFPHHLFVGMYIEWLIKSLTGEMASEVLVWLDDYRIIQGFITVKHFGGYSRVGLIAVDESSRGQQVGSLLMKAAEASCVRAGNTRIEVATQQDNIPACRFYEKLGYQVKQLTEIYHWWE